jgi:hypothetical protein
MGRVRLFVVLLCVALTACEPARNSEPARPDPTAEPWYPETTQRVASLHSEADALFRRGKNDEAAARITEAQPLVSRLLSVGRPTLAATRAASDIDDLYGRMLMANKHYGWARMQFQKNLARWKNWTPETEETQRMRLQAEKAIADCDRQLAR